jgi:hypothetical protein
MKTYGFFNLNTIIKPTIALFQYKLFQNFSFWGDKQSLSSFIDLIGKTGPDFSLI